jgi:cytochrome c
MKKIVIGCLALAALAACNSSSSTDEKKGKTTGDITQDPRYQKGLTLVAKNKCMTCHAIDETITGPPYREVANKYAGYPDTIVSHLAGKIISGGNGVWGEIFMTPHPDVSKEDAETMVKYILLLKK